MNKILLNKENIECEIFYNEFSFKTFMFSDSYQKWILNELKKTGCKIKFNHYKKNKSISILASSIRELTTCTLFIGYAYGMAENGR